MLTTYLLLSALIALVILSVMRASRKNHSTTKQQKEPFVAMLQSETAHLAEEIEIVGKPRIIRQAEHSRTQTQHTRPISNRTQHTHKQPNLVTAGDDLLEDEEIEEEIVSINRPVVSQTPPLVTAKSKPTPPSESQVSSVTTLKQNATLEVIVLHLVASPNQPYRGYELLQALLTAGLRYGKWNIFHRHQEITGRGPILFSLASSVEPGTFDLAKTGSFSTPSLTLFMRIADVEEPEQVFEKLLQAARLLTEELGGTVCDEKRQPLSEEKLSAWRASL